MRTIQASILILGLALAAGSTSAGCDDPTGEPCDGACPDGFYCKQDGYGNRCGGDDFGTCQPSPESCGADGPQVCACDHKIYANACEAARAGEAPVPYESSCNAPAGKISCGKYFCDEATQYCREVVEAYFECGDRPPGCNDCSCIPPVSDCTCVSAQRLVCGF